MNQEQKLLSSLLQETNIKEIESKIKLISDCYFEPHSINKTIFNTFKTIFYSNKSIIHLNNLFLTIKRLYPNLKITFEYLTNLTVSPITNEEFLATFEVSLKTIQKINFLINFKSEVNKLNFNNFNESTIQDLESKLLEYQKQTKTSKTTFYDEAKKFLLENPDVDTGLKNHQKNNYLTKNYHQFNDISGGFENGSLSIYSADSGFGKSTFALNLMLEITNQSFKLHQKHPKILMINYEMDAKQLLYRFFAILNENKTLNDIKTWNYRQTKELNQSGQEINISREYNEIKDVIENLKNYNFNLLIPTFNADISFLEHFIHIEKMKNEIDFLIIDHLHLMKDIKAAGLTETTDSIVWKLKILALILDIPIILLAQFNKESSKTTDKNMHSMKGSSSIAQHANLVFTLSKYEPSKQKQEKTVSNNGNDDNESDIIKVILEIHKNRQGRIGKIYFEFNKPFQTFKETDKPIELTQEKN